ncbi:MAG: GtrA family protein [Nocardioidaceae bacterium]
MSPRPLTARVDAVHRQALRFLLVGASTVAIDFVVYHTEQLFGVPLTPAKTVSFIVATVCAYLLNRSYTFGAAGGRSVIARFGALYAATLVVNVGVNAAALALLPPGRFHILGAFLCAQVVSSTINFVGMRHVVFTDRTGRRPAGLPVDQEPT